MSSVRLQLLKWLLTPIVLINLAGALALYWTTWAPAEKGFDQNLADAAWAILPSIKENGTTVAVDLSPQAEQVLRVDHFDAIYLAVRDHNGATISGDRDFPELRNPPRFNYPIAYDGVMRGEKVRITVLKVEFRHRDVFLGVAETEVKRNQARSKLMFTLALSQGIVVLASLIAVRFAIAKVLGNAPLDLANADTESDEPPLSPAPDLATAQGKSAPRSRQTFLTDVVRQLRMPMAELRQQQDWLMRRHGKESDTAKSLSQMMSATKLVSRKVDHLLALARTEPTLFEAARRERVELRTVIAELIQRSIAEADKKSIDLDFDLTPAAVVGDKLLLRDLAENLIDNAIRYTPVGGTVVIHCSQQARGSILSIADSGPGLDQAARDAILAPVRRAHDGSRDGGLGLAVVSDIARDHDARIELGVPPSGVGTLFTVIFPAPSGSKTPASAGS